MRKILLAGVAALGLLTGMTPALADYYEGGWYVRNNPGGREILYLGDNSDNTYRSLRGTARYCGSPGNSYAQMRRVMGNEYDQLSWWDTNNCTVVTCVSASPTTGVSRRAPPTSTMAGSMVTAAAASLCVEDVDRKNISRGGNSAAFSILKYRKGRRTCRRPSIEMVQSLR